MWQVPASGVCCRRWQLPSRPRRPGMTPWSLPLLLRQQLPGSDTQTVHYHLGWLYGSHGTFPQYIPLLTRQLCLQIRRRNFNMMLATSIWFWLLRRWHSCKPATFTTFSRPCVAHSSKSQKPDNTWNGRISQDIVKCHFTGSHLCVQRPTCTSVEFDPTNNPSICLWWSNQFA